MLNYDDIGIIKSMINAANGNEIETCVNRYFGKAEIANKVFSIIEKILTELSLAMKKYPLGFQSNHEALGVIREEYKEFEDEIFHTKEFYTSTEKQRDEAIQLAAMVIRFMINIPDAVEMRPSEIEKYEQLAKHMWETLDEIQAKESLEQPECDITGTAIKKLKSN